MLRVPAPLHDQVIAHCQQEYPKEACGILAAEARSKNGLASGREVVQVYPMTNVEASPIGYSMDPREQLRVERQMRQAHQQMVGIYHSHTATDAYPSSVDVSLAISPEISYVLISLKDRAHPIMNSYRIDGQTISVEALHDR